MPTAHTFAQVQDDADLDALLLAAVRSIHRVLRDEHLGALSAIWLAEAADDINAVRAALARDTEEA